MNTDIAINRMYVLPDQSKPLKAFCDIIINGAIVIKGVKVVNGKNGLFSSMPQEHNDQTKKWYPTVRVLTQEIRDTFQEVVIDAYNKAMNK